MHLKHPALSCKPSEMSIVMETIPSGLSYIEEEEIIVCELWVVGLVDSLFTPNETVRHLK